MEPLPTYKKAYWLKRKQGKGHLASKTKRRRKYAGCLPSVVFLQAHHLRQQGMQGSTSLNNQKEDEWTQVLELKPL